MAAMSIAIEGALLKEGLRTHTLNSRHVRIYSDCRLEYWESKNDKPPTRLPRGKGTVIAVEEWWPARRKGVAMVAQDVLAISQKVQNRQVSFSLGASNKTGLSHADENQFDGRTFLLRVELAGSPGIKAMHLVAPTRAERLQWFAVVGTAVDRDEAAADGSSTDSSPSTATGDGGADSEEAAAPSSAPPSAASAATAAEQAVLDELPDVWKLWADHGELAAATERYGELVRRAPRCWSVLQDRGNFHMSQGEHRRAEADFSSALELHSTRPELHNDRAVCRIEQGRHADALPDLEAALSLRPTFPQALSNLGNVQRELGELDKAKHAYNSALLLAPKDACVRHTATPSPSHDWHGATPTRPPVSLHSHPAIARAARRRTWNNRGALQEQMGNLVAAELDVRRALELGGCAKAEHNLHRICTELSGRGGMELRPLQPCWEKAPPAPTQCALVTFTFEEGPIGMFLVNSVSPTEGGGEGGTEGAQDGDGGGGADVDDDAKAAAACVWAHAKPGEVIVHTVYEDSQAHDAGVPIGCVLVGINGRTIGKMAHGECSGLLGQAARPLALRMRCPPGWRARASDILCDEPLAEEGMHAAVDLREGEQALAVPVVQHDATPLPPGDVDECPE